MGLTLKIKKTPKNWTKEDEDKRENLKKSLTANLRINNKEKLSILENTIKMIEKYYEDNNIDITIYHLNSKVIKKEKYGSDEIINKKYANNLLKSLLKDEVLHIQFFLKIHKINEKKYYPEIYDFFVDYGNFYKAYCVNKDTMTHLNNAVKSNIVDYKRFKKKNLEHKYLRVSKYISKELKPFMKFHRNIKQNQLSAYFCYYNQNINEPHKTFFTLMFLLFRKDIRLDRNKTNLTIKNPYIKH